MMSPTELKTNPKGNIMTEENTAVETVETEGSDVKIVIDTDTYTKERNASGQLTQHNGDVVASGLVKLVLAETYAVAAELLDADEDELRGKYQHLNPGQQRMNLGNRIRGCVNRADKALAKAAAAQGEDSPELPQSGADLFALAIEPFNNAIQGRADAADKAAIEKAEKAAVAKKEKEAKAEAKAAAKAEAAEEADAA